MKLGLIGSVLSLFVLGACATSAKAVVTDDPAAGEPGTGIGAPAPEEEEDDVTKQPPHSLGTILLGESHGSGTASKSTPIVSASFVPDALLTKSCKKKLDAGCEIFEVPKCTKVTTSTTGCDAGETCAFDDSCKAVCSRVALCEKACAEDETCKLVQPLGTSTTGTCVKRELFDAGPLAFSGTTTAITLYPPYSFESDGQGAPFLAGAELRVQAQGATEAGFEKFDEKFTSTTFIQTTPSLAKIPREKVFGTGPLPVAWAPANDTILINLSGIGGTATCKVKDADGKFDVPRSVVDAALGVGTTTGTTGTQTLSVSVARQRKEVKKDKKAKGELSQTKVIPTGWLELVTLSTESASFQGCASTQSICGETCTDTKTDRNNCGTCGNVCTSAQSCVSGKCTTGGTTTTCDSCLSSYCPSQRSSCLSNSYCSALKTCYEGCTTSSCQSSCRSSYPSGTTYFDSLNSCKASYCSSSCAF